MTRQLFNAIGADLRRWIFAALAGVVICNLVLVLLVSVSTDRPVVQTASNTVVGRVLELGRATGADSWRPLAEADRVYREDPEADLYRVLFDHDVKFQYPPFALTAWRRLPLYGGPGSVRDGSRLRTALGIASALALLLTVAVSIVLFYRSYGVSSGESADVREAGLAALVGAGLLGVAFYPLLKGHLLGQIQVFLNLAIATGLLTYSMGKRASTGMLLGLCCLIKPQYAVIALWGIVRRDWRFVGGFAAVAAGGLCVSVYEFGLQNHISYANFLQYITSHGEAYWPNQSVNGIVNRWLGNGDAVRFSQEFAPFHPIVYAATLASAALFVAVAVWPTRFRRRNAFDLSIALIAATMSAPVAWEHHYGVLLPVLAVTVPTVMRERPFGSYTGLYLLAAFLMTASVLTDPELLFSNHYLGLTASHLFVGALMLLVICFWITMPAGTRYNGRTNALATLQQ